MGFEPTTSTLARLRSTPELHPLEMSQRNRKRPLRDLYAYHGKKQPLFWLFSHPHSSPFCRTASKCGLSMKFSRQTRIHILCCDGMKELLITLITLAGLFIGVYYHDSLVGGGQEDQQQKTETSVSGQ